MISIPPSSELSEIEPDRHASAYLCLLMSVINNLKCFLFILYNFGIFLTLIIYFIKLFSFKYLVDTAIQTIQTYPNSELSVLNTDKYAINSLYKIKTGVINCEDNCISGFYN